MASPTTNPYSHFPNFLVTFPTSPDPLASPRSIALIEINRPRQLNAWTHAMFPEYKKIWDLLSADRDVRVVILTGAGERAFTAGLDLKSAGSVLGGGDEGIGKGEEDWYRKARLARKDIEWLQKCTAAGEGSGKPLICLLHGYSYGLALDLACTADIRIATTHSSSALPSPTSKPTPTTLCIKEIDIGIAADLGVLTRLPKLIGSMTFLKHHALTGLPFSPAEALTQGFVSEVVSGGKNEGMKRCMEIAAMICEKSPVAVEGILNIVDQGLGRPVEEGLKFTQVWNAPAILSKDVGEAVRANVGRRRGVFGKL